MIRNLLAALGRNESAAPPAQGAGRKTILIIDHHAESLSAMCLAFSGEEYRVEAASTGLAAIGKISTVPPDLILVDPQFSAEDGTRLVRRLLADEKIASVPVLALMQTARSTSDDRAIADRFDGTFPKLADGHELADAVRRLLQKSLTRGSHPSQPAAEPDVFTEVDADAPASLTAVLDAIEAGLPDSQFPPGTRAGLHRLAEAVEDLRNFELAGYIQQAERLSSAHTARARIRFRSLIRLCRDHLQREPDPAPGLADLRAGYLDHRRAELSSLDQALENGDLTTLRKAGHNLKGMGQAYGFGELTDIGRALETAAKDGDTGSIEILLDQIDAYINIVRPSPEHRGAYESGT